VRFDAPEISSTLRAIPHPALPGVAPSARVKPVIHAVWASSERSPGG
jgi:hypothetical protein